MIYWGYWNTAEARRLGSALHSLSIDGDCCGTCGAALPGDKHQDMRSLSISGMAHVFGQWIRGGERGINQAEFLRFLSVVAVPEPDFKRMYRSVVRGANARDVVARWRVRRSDREEARRKGYRTGEVFVRTDRGWTRLREQE